MVIIVIGESDDLKQNILVTDTGFITKSNDKKDKINKPKPSKPPIIVNKLRLIIIIMK